MPRHPPDVAVVDGSGAGRAAAVCGSLEREGLSAVSVSALELAAYPSACAALLMPADSLPDAAHHVLSVVASLRDRVRARIVVAWHVPHRSRSGLAAGGGNSAPLLLGTGWQRELRHHASPADAVRCRDRQVRRLMAPRLVGGKSVAKFCADVAVLDPSALHDITAQVAEYGEEERLFWPPPDSVTQAVLLRSGQER